jgi:RHS repeat-associated protein
MNRAARIITRLFRIAATVALILNAAGQETPDVAGVFNESLPSLPAANPNTGALQYTYTFQLPQARGLGSPRLGITYNSSVRDGEAGYGWRLNVPSIERQPLSGWPSYDDTKDRYAFDGNPLVFICIVGGSGCPADERFPTFLGSSASPGARYFRLQVEGAFMRFFLMPSGYVWFVQLKGGRTQTYGSLLPTSVTSTQLPGFGVPLNGVDTDENGKVFRWHLIVESDPRRNFTIYRWNVLGARGLVYLTDVYDTLPPSDLYPNVNDYAHHTGLTWEPAGLRLTRYSHIDKASPDMVLTRVAVASKSWTGTGERLAVRVYQLEYLSQRAKPNRCVEGLPCAGITYDPTNDAPLWGHSFLRTIRMQGACGGREVNGQLPAEITCDSLPPVSFEYQSFKLPTNAVGPSADITGVPLNTIVNSQVITDAPNAAVIDLNQDGLPDVVQTWPYGVALTPNLANWRVHTGYLNKGELNTGQVRFSHQCIDAGAVLGYNSNKPGSLLSSGSPGGFGASGLVGLLPGFGASIIAPWGGSLLLWSTIGYSSVAAQQTPAMGAFCAAVSATPPDPNHPAWQWLPNSEVGWSAPTNNRGSGNNPNNPTYPYFVDVDGDGLPDAFALRQGEAPEDLELATVFFSRRLAGDDSPRYPKPALVPFQLNSAALAAPPITVAPTSFPQFLSQPSRYYYADINGDGLPDLIVQNPGYDHGIPRVRPGDGRGFFSCADDKEPGGCAPRSRVDSSAYLINFPDPVKPGQFNGPQYFHDVTGDGLADLVMIDLLTQSEDAFPGVPMVATGKVRLWVNEDGHNFRCANPGNECVVGYLIDQVHGGFFGEDILNHRAPHVAFVDLKGRGIDDIVVLAAEGIFSLSLFQASVYTAPRPGLLTRIHNGYGATSEIQYQTIQQLDAAAERAGSPWNFHSPEVVSVVTHIKTENSQVVGTNATLFPPFGITREVSFDYRDPAYDRWNRRFIGFRKVRVQSPGEQTVETTYWYGPCQRAIQDCVDSSDDDPYATRIGLPVKIDRYSDLVLSQQGLGWLSSTILSYTDPEPLFPNSDPSLERHVRRSYPYAVRTYIYDPTKIAESGGPPLITPGDPLEPPRSQPSRVEVLRLVSIDKFGNPRTAEDFGRVDIREKPIDDLLMTTIDYCSASLPCGDLRAPCDEQWICSPQMSTTQAPKTPDRQARFSYTPFAELKDVQKFVKGSAPLSRFHEDPTQPTAPPPPTASTQGWANVIHFEYDIVGNIMQVRGPSASPPVPCTTIEYDPLFLQFPAVIHAHTGDGCSSSSLDTTTEYDRGFGLLQVQIDPRGGISLNTFDPFGRVFNVYTPLPDAPVGAIVHSLAVRYTDNSPINYVRLDRSVGPGHKLMTSFVVFNALGERVLRFDNADQSSGDPGNWVVRDWLERDQMGRPVRMYQPWFFSGNPPDALASAALPTNGIPIIPHPSNGELDFSYDPFGRRKFVMENGMVVANYRYAPLTVDVFDAEQFKGTGLRAGLFQRLKLDGHGRVIKRSRSLHDDTVITTTTYLATGEPATVVQSHASGTDMVTRNMIYDSLGRLVMNVEPNTTTNNHSWTYAWDDAGRLVGTSDARGCGENLFYDGLERLIARDFSPCKKSHLPYTIPNLLTGDGTEAFYRYDGYDDGQVMPEAGFADNAALAPGNPVSILDRGSYTRFNYDSRGRVRRVSRRIANPGPPAAALMQRYSPHWYAARADFDLGDRIMRRSTGIDVPDLFGTDGASQEFYSYTDRGVIKNISSSYGSLVNAVNLDADGLPLEIIYGDAASTKATFMYDDRRRLHQYILTRKSSPVWSLPTTTYSIPPIATTPLELAVLQYTYDDVSNLMELDDQAAATPWPEGAKPVSRAFEYDDLYRVTKTAYSYALSNLQVSPFAHEAQSGDTSPVPLQQADTRIGQQQIQYDWKGNHTKTTDDLNLTYDRSLGQIVNGESQGKPNQLMSAAGGRVQAHYDEAGNMVDLVVERSGSCKVGASDLCSQRFVFDWDEVGQLARGRRWDYPGSSIPASEPRYPLLPTSAPAKDVEYVYSGGKRVIKSIRDSAGQTLYTLEVFDTLRVNHTTVPVLGEHDYVRSVTTETAYLAGLGRLVYAPNLPPPLGLPSPLGNPLHLLLQIGDHLGSTSIVIDGQTGEVVEKLTYQAQGAPESDYRPERWQFFREDYRFTGKEEDTELGIAYFGARYYHPRLGRWLSPDPASIHFSVSDPNPYAYVHGRLATTVDALGLDDGTDDNQNSGCVGEGCHLTNEELGAYYGKLSGETPTPPPPDTSADSTSNDPDEKQLNRRYAEVGTGTPTEPTQSLESDWRVAYSQLRQANSSEQTAKMVTLAAFTAGLAAAELGGLRAVQALSEFVTDVSLRFAATRPLLAAAIVSAGEAFSESPTGAGAALAATAEVRAAVPGTTFVERAATQLMGGAWEALGRPANMGKWASIAVAQGGRSGTYIGTNNLRVWTELMKLADSNQLNGAVVVPFIEGVHSEVAVLSYMKANGIPILRVGSVPSGCYFCQNIIHVFFPGVTHENPRP